MCVCVSCSIPYKIPYGKWQSSDPKLTLDINPNKLDRSGLFTGTYTKDGVMYDILIGFKMYKGFTVIDEKYRTDEGIYGGNEYFWGDFKIKQGKLIYALRSRWQEETEYKVIEFELIEAYEPPAK